MEIVTEVWKKVGHQFPEYSASNLGSVRRDTKRGRKSGRIISQCYTDQGYKRVIATNSSGKPVTTRAHRLVAMAFVEGYREGLEVNHKNGIKDDNRPENLEWVTGQENVRHAVLTGLHLGRPRTKQRNPVLS